MMNKMKRTVFAADPDFLDNYLNRREQILEIAKSVKSEEFSNCPVADTPDAVKEIMKYEGDTAYITVSGPLSMEGPDWIDRYFGLAGVSYTTIIAALDQAVSDQMIKNIVILADTPGGYLDGADITWQSMQSACSKKNVTTHVSGMLASAGYYICCPTKIYATAKTDSIGSIGVVIAGYDYSGFETEIGIKHWKILSKNAPKKQADGSTKTGRDTLQEMVDAQERNFYQSISKSRGVTPYFIAENYGQGALLVASDPDNTMPSALKNGLIDGFVSLNGEEIPDYDTFNLPDDGPEGGCGKKKSETVKTPASAGGNISQEVQKMNLNEFLAQGPAAAAELEKYKAEAVAGVVAQNKTVAAKCAAIIESDKYSDVCKKQAAKALKGETSLDALDAVVAVFDMQEEQKKNAAAKTEQSTQPETIPGSAQGNGEAEQIAAMAYGIAHAGKLPGGK
jgi:ClpP class serine protease